MAYEVVHDYRKFEKHWVRDTSLKSVNIGHLHLDSSLGFSFCLVLMGLGSSVSHTVCFGILSVLYLNTAILSSAEYPL
jgi:hypothetical protein